MICFKHIHTNVKGLECCAFQMTNPQREWSRRIVKSAGNSALASGRKESTVHRGIAAVERLAELAAKQIGGFAGRKMHRRSRGAVEAECKQIEGRCTLRRHDLTRRHSSRPRTN